MRQLDLKFETWALSQADPHFLLISSFIASGEDAAEHGAFPIEELQVRPCSVPALLWVKSPLLIPAARRQAEAPFLGWFHHFLGSYALCWLATNLDNDFTLISAALK
jgi:hypothetical protein